MTQKEELELLKVKVKALEVEVLKLKQVPVVQPIIVPQPYIPYDPYTPWGSPWDYPHQPIITYYGTETSKDYYLPAVFLGDNNGHNSGKD